MMPLIDEAKTLFDLTLTPAQVEQFDTYARELTVWNETRMNLTAITDPEAVRVRHFLDSLSVIKAMPLQSGIRLLDVGTGAGFPGLPLAMVLPDIQVILMDSTAKKLTFIDHLITTLQVPNATTLHARAEDAGRSADHRGQYDVVVARAVARLPALLEYLLPFVKVGGYAIAMKGTTAHEEAESANRALYVLGGELQTLIEVNLPDIDDPHYLVVVKKTRKTPKPYPRKAGTPTRQPIGT